MRATMPEETMTRWIIRTALGDYYATADTEVPDTFIATPARIHNGFYNRPAPVTFRCEYIIEQHQRKLPLEPRLRYVVAAGPVNVLAVS